jgi:hypothetical protein
MCDHKIKIILNSEKDNFEGCVFACGFCEQKFEFNTENSLETKNGLEKICQLSKD